jgi:hypothetical protein
MLQLAPRPGLVLALPTDVGNTTADVRREWRKSPVAGHFLGCTVLGCTGTP